MYMLPHRTHTSYPCCIPAFTVLSGQDCIQASMQLRHCAAGAKSLPHASCFVFSVIAKIVSLKNHNKSPLHYKKHILLIFEHHGSLESNFSILPLWFWHRKVLIWLQKATFMLKVWEIIKQWMALLSQKIEEMYSFCIIIYDIIHAL